MNLVVLVLLVLVFSHYQRKEQRTVEKWVRENNKELNTTVWFKFDMADRDHVATLRCSVCCQFKDKLESMRNFRSAFIDGTTNHRLRSMQEWTLFKKHQSSNVCDYTPIAKCLAQSSMDSATIERTKRKFDIAYTIVKENLAFTKMKSISKLEEQHGVNLEDGYKNDQACSTFVKFIACEQQNLLIATLSKSNFFSIQADASTDSVNVLVEMYLVLHFDPFSEDGKVQVRSRFFSARHLVVQQVNVFSSLLKKL